MGLGKLGGRGSGSSPRWVALSLLALTFYALPATASAAGWSAAAPMGVQRAQQSSTLLPDGEVLVAGGYDGFVEGVGGSSVSLASAELFDPVTGSWRPVAPMHVPRADQTTTLLGDGDVLAVGGREGIADKARSAEIYDPATDTWTAITPPPGLQLADTATLLPDGDVLVTGLFGPQEPGAIIGAIEFHPATDAWTSVPAPPSEAERDRTAVGLPDGQVLIAGGVSFEEIGPPEHAVQEIQTAYADAEVFDPSAGTWTRVSPMHAARLAPTATLLPDGDVLVAGGLTEISPAGAGAGLASTEAFDPATRNWTARAPMLFARGKHSASRLPDGRVLVAGGSPCSPAACIGFGAQDGCCAADTAEIYDPAGDAWSATEPVLTLAEHAASVLPGGSVLVSGGNYDFADTHETNAAEIYGALPPPAPSSALPSPPAPILRLWRLRQSHRRWREPGAPTRRGGRRRPQIPIGTTFSFELSEAASVTLRFRSRRRPRESIEMTVAGVAGRNRVPFKGRPAGLGRLGAGSYTVQASAQLAGATSTSGALGFRILGASDPRRKASRSPG